MLVDVAHMLRLVPNHLRFTSTAWSPRLSCLVAQYCFSSIYRKKERTKFIIYKEKTMFNLLALLLNKFYFATAQT